MSMLLNYILGELLQHFFVGNIANKVVGLLFVNYPNRGSKFPEFFCYTSSDALRTTCDDYYFFLKSIFVSVR